MVSRNLIAPMRSEIHTEKSVFLKALDIESPSERAAFIEVACQGNPDLLAAVSALFDAHESDGNPVDRPIAADAMFKIDDLDETEWRPAPSRPAHHALGTRIGVYKLMEQIGEGGFGLVYVADQQEPVRRRVALEDYQTGDGVARGAHALRGRAAGHRTDGPPEYRPNLRRGRDRFGTAILRDGARSWRAAHCVLRQPQARYVGAAQAFRDNLPCGAARSSKRHHSPRLEAFEYFGSSAESVGKKTLLGRARGKGP